MVIKYLKEGGQSVKTGSIHVRERFDGLIGIESKTVELIEFVSAPDIVSELGEILKRQRMTRRGGVRKRRGEFNGSSNGRRRKKKLGGRNRNK
jgi:hypothetical protein